MLDGSDIFWRSSASIGRQRAKFMQLIGGLLPKVWQTTANY